MENAEQLVEGIRKFTNIIIANTEYDTQAAVAEKIVGLSRSKMSVIITKTDISELVDRQAKVNNLKLSLAKIIDFLDRSIKTNQPLRNAVEAEAALLDACRPMVSEHSLTTSQQKWQAAYAGLYENFYLVIADKKVYFVKNAVELFNDGRMIRVSKHGPLDIRYPGDFKFSDNGAYLHLTTHRRIGEESENDEMKGYYAILSTRPYPELKGIYHTYPGERPLLTGHDYLRKVEEPIESERKKILDDIDLIRVRINPKTVSKINGNPSKYSKEFMELLEKNEDYIEIFDFLNGSKHLAVYTPNSMDYNIEGI